MSSTEQAALRLIVRLPPLQAHNLKSSCYVSTLHIADTRVNVGTLETNAYHTTMISQYTHFTTTIAQPRAHMYLILFV